MDDAEKGLTLSLFMRDGKLTRQGMKDIGVALTRDHVSLTKSTRQELLESALDVMRDPKAHASARMRAMELLRVLDQDELDRAEKALAIIAKIEALVATSEPQDDVETDYSTWTQEQLDAEYARLNPDAKDSP